MMMFDVWKWNNRFGCGWWWWWWWRWWKKINFNNYKIRLFDSTLRLILCWFDVVMWLDVTHTHTLTKHPNIRKKWNIPSVIHTHTYNLFFVLFNSLGPGYFISRIGSDRIGQPHYGFDWLTECVFGFLVFANLKMINLLLLITIFFFLSLSNVGCHKRIGKNLFEYWTFGSMKKKTEKNLHF